LQHRPGELEVTFARVDVRAAQQRVCLDSGEAALLGPRELGVDELLAL